nr:hypothetical protein [Streptomyces sp. NBC_01435]
MSGVTGADGATGLSATGLLGNGGSDDTGGNDGADTVSSCGGPFGGCGAGGRAGSGGGSAGTGGPAKVRGREGPTGTAPEARAVARGGSHGARSPTGRGTATTPGTPPSVLEATASAREGEVSAPGDSPSAREGEVSASGALPSGLEATAAAPGTPPPALTAPDAESKRSSRLSAASLVPVSRAFSSYSLLHQSSSWAAGVSPC